jgi:glycosyltransferase involved in cell wall biosynthesis
MTIVFDITRLLKRSANAVPTGIDRVVLAYARRLLDRRPDTTIFMARWRLRSAALSPACVADFIDAVSSRWEYGDEIMNKDETARLEEFLAFPAGVFGRAAATPDARPSRPALLPLLPGILSPQTIWQKTLRASPTRSGAVYLNVSHDGFNGRSQTGHWTQAQRLKPVFLVHDLIPLSHAEYARPGEAERHRQRMQAVVSSAAAVIANSNHTKAVLAEFAAENQVADLPIVVSPLGVENKFHADPLPDMIARARHGGQPIPPYFLMIGTIEPRKNHLLILGLWRHLAEELGERTPKLVIVGRRGWENENVIDMIERCRALQPHVLECNRMSDHTLRRLMLGSRAILFPSFAEGYGLPLVEALALRVPAICSDLAVFREVAGAIPEYLAPIDGVGWLRIIQQYAMPLSPARQNQVARLSNFVTPTWDAHFDVVEQVVERARLGRPAEPASSQPSPREMPRPGGADRTNVESARSKRRRAI